MTTIFDDVKTRLGDGQKIFRESTVRAMVEEYDRLTLFYTCAYCGTDVPNDPEKMNAHIQECTQRPEAKLLEILSFHPRAAKLMAKRRQFIVIAMDEPYFKAAYEFIRAHEIVKNTWTEEDERLYRVLISGEPSSN